MAVRSCRVTVTDIQGVSHAKDGVHVIPDASNQFNAGGAGVIPIRWFGFCRKCRGVIQSLQPTFVEVLSQNLSVRGCGGPLSLRLLHLIRCLRKLRIVDVCYLRLARCESRDRLLECELETIWVNVRPALEGKR